jgi:hypothetical protein
MKAKAILISHLICFGGLQAGNIVVTAGGDFQAALNSAQPGDTITLTAGATYSGHFTLPFTGGASFITIQSSALGQLPPDGVRTSPSYASLMPKLVTPDGLSVLTATGGAHHFRFLGIEITTLEYANDIVRLGTAYETSLSQLPQYIEFDRVWVHGDPTKGSKRCIALNSRDATIQNSYISDCKSDSQDSQALAGWNGPGPFKIYNNHLEGAAEGVVFGGALPTIPGLIPSDIDVRGNHFYKPLTWRSGDPNYQGVPWLIKNHFELKNAQRVTLDGNYFENNWVQSDQSGFAIQLTTRDEYGNAPWAVVKDITITNNFIRHSGAGVNFYGTEGLGLHNVVIRNNVFEDVTAAWGGDGRLLQFLGGVSNITLDHNTSMQSNVAAVFIDTVPGFVFTNNILASGTFHSPETSPGIAALLYRAPNYVEGRNCWINGTSAAGLIADFLAPSLSAVGFVNPAQSDYHLAANSPYKNAGTDGRDLGADIDAITAALAFGASSLQLETSPGVATLPSGGSLQFTATAMNSPAAAVTWSIQPYDLGTISPTGFYTAPIAASTSRTVTITAVSTVDGSKSASVAVSLLPNTAVTTFSVTTSATTVAVGGTVTVSWSAPAGRPSADWIQLMDAAGTTQYWYLYTGGASSGSATVPMPAQTGQYVFRYLLNDGYGEAARSAIITVQNSAPAAPTYSLAPSATSFQANTQVSVSWTAPAGSSANDWIQLTDASINTQYGYKYTGGAATGTVTFTAPAASGQYIFRYLLNNSYTEAARTVITVTGATISSYTLTSNVTSLSAGGSITINWTAPAGTSSSDWIQFINQAGTQFWYLYTGGQSSGSATVPAPEQGGQYVFRYLLNNTYNEAARSAVITVQNSSPTAVYSLAPSATSVQGNTSMSVSWTAPAGSSANDWIQLTDSTVNTQYWYKYTGGAATGSFTFTTPTVNGQYILRYLLNNTYTEAARTVITVTGAAASSYVLTANVSTVSAGASITINWAAPAGSSSSDWIQLMNAGGNTQYWYLYTGGAASGSATVPAPAQAGQYVFRYLLNNTYTEAARSAVITVQNSSAAYSLTPSATSVQANTPMSVNWTAPVGSSAIDWIQLTDSTVNTQYWYKYTDGASNGTFTFTAPAANGQYILRYLLNNTYAEAVRTVITVTGASQ